MAPGQVRTGHDRVGLPEVSCFPDSVIALENSVPFPSVTVATVERKYGFTFDGAKVIPDPDNPSRESPVTSYSLAK